MKSYANLDKRINDLKRSRVPDFLGGDFETLLRSELRNRIGDLEYVRILQEGRDIGKQEGLEIGVEEGIKNYIIGGQNQLFISKKGEAYPFSNMQEIYKSEKTTPYLTEFIKEHEKINHKNLVSEYDESMKKADQFIWDNNMEDSLFDVVTHDKLKSNVSKLEKEINDLKIKMNSSKSPKKVRQMKTEKQKKVKELEVLQKPVLLNYHIKNSDKIIQGNVDPITLASRYSRKDLKPGDVAIFKTDEFSIYNVPHIQKYLSKDKKELKDIRESSFGNFDKLIDTHINDLRKNPPRYERTIDYIDFPSTKVNLFEKKVNDRFNGNPPDNIKQLLNNMGSKYI